MVTVNNHFIIIKYFCEKLILNDSSPKPWSSGAVSTRNHVFYRARTVGLRPHIPFLICYNARVAATKMGRLDSIESVQEEMEWTLCWSWAWELLETRRYWPRNHNTRESNIHTTDHSHGLWTELINYWQLVQFSRTQFSFQMGDGDGYFWFWCVQRKL